MFIETLAQRWQCTHPDFIFSTTNGGFASIIPVSDFTPPSGDGVLNMAPAATGSVVVQNGIILMPIATGTAGDTFGMQVWGWSELHSNPIDRGVSIWVPYLLCSVTVTISTSIVGVANTILGTNILFCDQIALVTGNANVSNEIVSPGSGILAHLLVDMKGSKRIGVYFNMTQGDAGAALYKFV